MFDEHYFRTMMARDIEAAGGHPIVDLQLLSGHSHRVRAIVEIGTGCITLETYLARGDLAQDRPRFGAPEGESAAKETFRTVIAYESIAAVVFDPSPSQSRVRTGFASG